MTKPIPVLEYLEFTQLSNIDPAVAVAGLGFRVRGIYTALKQRNRICFTACPVLEYLEFTQLSNLDVGFGLDEEVLEYLEFTQLSNQCTRKSCKTFVLEYLEFTQLSNRSHGYKTTFEF